MTYATLLYLGLAQPWMWTVVILGLAAYLYGVRYAVAL
jgi:hypothetical protein